MKRRFLVYYCYALLFAGIFACKKEPSLTVEEDPVFNTFREMETDLPYQRYLQAVFLNDSTGFVVGDKGTLMKTANGGKNWTSVDSHTEFTLSDIQFMNSSTGYILGYNDEKKGVILRTTNTGDSWEIFRHYDDLKPEGMSFPDANTGFILLGGKRLLQTKDGGATWSENSVDIQSANNMQFYDPVNGYITSENGFYYETWNGGLTWSRRKASLSEGLYQLYFRDDRVIFKSDTRLYFRSLLSVSNVDLVTIPSSELLEFTNDGRAVAIGQRPDPKSSYPVTYVYVGTNELKNWPEKLPSAGIMTLSKLSTTKFLMIGGRSAESLIFTLEL